MKFSIAALALTAAFGSAFATAAEAQNFPSKPIRAIVSSSAGGTSDIFMRVLAEELHKRLGQPVIVENRPGGAFNIGARVCAELLRRAQTEWLWSGGTWLMERRIVKSAGPARICRL